MKAGLGFAAICLMAAVAAMAAARLGVPLAWVLMPMAVTGAASASGVKLPALAPGRKFGQAVIGASIGLTLSAGALGPLLAWAPLAVVAAVFSVALTGVLSLIFARLSGESIATAFFSLTPGGLSEMANIGTAEGARTEVVALSQALRVAILVTALPLLLRNFGQDGGLFIAHDGLVLDWPRYLLVMLGAVAFVPLFRSLGLSNPWMIGPLFGAGLFSVSGLVTGGAPELPVILGQYLIGLTLGARFQRHKMQGLTRVLLLACLMILLMSLILGLAAGALSLATALSFSTTMLILSPGGMVEMALTARALHLDVVLVTVFHVIRSFVVNAWILHCYRIFLRVIPRR